MNFKKTRQTSCLILRDELQKFRVRLSDLLQDCVEHARVLLQQLPHLLELLLVAQEGQRILPGALLLLKNIHSIRCLTNQLRLMLILIIADPKCVGIF